MLLQQTNKVMPNCGEQMRQQAAEGGASYLTQEQVEVGASQITMCDIISHARQSPLMNPHFHSEGVFNEMSLANI